jgi:hypothetical protein
MLKLLRPDKTYGAHLHELVARRAVARPWPTYWSKAARWRAATAATLLAPPGLLLRTTQICGSFVIINGLVAALAPRRSVL